MKKIFLYGILSIFLLSCSCALTGCSVIRQEEEKQMDIDFTVVPDTELPKEIAEFIEQKKTGEMKNTYTTEDSLYLIVGYGEQKTSGYSITVNECYLGKDAIYLDTSLIGPAKGEKIDEVVTYPYIVIKIEKREEPVVFQ